MRDDFDATTCVGDGWVPIVEELVDTFKELDLGDRFEIVQVKEKFGGLRFYYSFQPPEGANDIEIEMYKAQERLIDSFIRVAEYKCSKTCEVCGKPGSTRLDRNWVLTLCDRHHFKVTDV